MPVAILKSFFNALMLGLTGVKVRTSPFLNLIFILLSFLFIFLFFINRCTVPSWIKATDEWGHLFHPVRYPQTVFKSIVAKHLLPDGQAKLIAESRGHQIAQNLSFGLVRPQHNECVRIKVAQYHQLSDGRLPLHTLLLKPQGATGRDRAHEVVSGLDGVDEVAGKKVVYVDTQTDKIAYPDRWRLQRFGKYKVLLQTLMKEDVYKAFSPVA